MTPWLSPAEIDELCEPLTQAAAQRRYLRDLGVTVREKPNGQPLVMRSNVEAVLGGLPMAPKKRAAAPAERHPVAPNVVALRRALSR